jgi:hypothetical protein
MAVGRISRRRNPPCHGTDWRKEDGGLRFANPPYGLSARDDKEEARAGDSDQRYNHWTAVRNRVMNAPADALRLLRAHLLKLVSYPRL